MVQEVLSEQKQMRSDLERLSEERRLSVDQQVCV